MPAEMTIHEGKTDGGLSVVFLCFNDAPTIASCVEQAFVVLQSAVKEVEVIVVEDGSRDHSKKVLYALAQKYPALTVIYHARNMGYGASLADGVMAATKEFVLCVDGDNQFDLNDAPVLFRIAERSYEIVSGCRIPRADPWYRCAAGWLFNRAVQIIFALPVKDVDCGFKLLNRDAARQLFPTRSNLLVWVEALIKAKARGYRCADTIVHHRPRLSGQSTVFRFSGIAQILYELISVGLRFKRLNTSPGMLHLRIELQRGEINESRHEIGAACCNLGSFEPTAIDACGPKWRRDRDGPQEL